MIEIAHSLKFPLDVVTQSLAILARKRAGKSYMARGFAEQLLRADQQVVIIDPKGDWWGIRSAADGKNPGFPVVILGGEHGDLPLEKTASDTVARLIVEERVSVLLDLSQFRKSEVAIFLGGDARQHYDGLLEIIYRLKSKEEFRTPMMLIVDEADAVAPQKPYPGEERMLGAMEDIVRRGGQRGIGSLLLTQRSSVINKNVLTQSQVMIAMRTIAELDITAMMAWVDVHGTPEQAKVLKGSLPSLPTGDAWVLSPGWPDENGIFKRIHGSSITTFDSGATPKPGEKRLRPRNLADVNLRTLEVRMAEAIERHKADDPRELKKKITELERQIREKPKVQAITKPSTLDIDNAIASFMKRKVLPVFDRMSVKLLNYASGTQQLSDEFSKQVKDMGLLVRAASVEQVKVISSPRQIVTPTVRTAGNHNGTVNLTLGKCERAILRVLAQFPDGCASGKLTLISGYRYSGGFKNSLTRLRSNGLMDGDNTGIMKITDEGVSVVGDFDPLPTGSGLFNYWFNSPTFGKCEKAILSALRETPGLSGPQVAVASGYEYSGGFKNALTNLRTAGVVIGSNIKSMDLSGDLRD